MQRSTDHLTHKYKQHAVVSVVAWRTHSALQLDFAKERRVQRRYASWQTASSYWLIHRGRIRLLLFLCTGIVVQCPVQPGPPHLRVIESPGRCMVAPCSASACMQRWYDPPDITGWGVRCATYGVSYNNINGRSNANPSKPVMLCYTAI